MKKGIIFVVSGPSGAGKSTIIEKLVKRDKRLKFSVSATTRPKRRGEKEGIHYFFVNKEKFKNMIKKDNLLEWAEFQGNFYGTPEKFVNETVNKNYDIVLDIDVQGAVQAMKKLKDAVYIFITPKSLAVLRNRLISRRTDDAGAIKKRLKIAHGEMQHIDMYKYFVINDDLNEAVKGVKAVITAERSKIARNKDVITKLKKKI
ncbi:MAG: guanylate kinase [Armatimonadota bacterium]